MAEFLRYALPMPVVAAPGQTVTLNSILNSAYGGVPGSWQDFWLTWSSATFLASNNLDYWNLASPQVGQWKVNGIATGPDLANQVYVGRAAIGQVSLTAGNVIGPLMWMLTPLSKTGNTINAYTQHALITIDPAVLSPVAGDGAPTPQDIVDTARRFDDFYGFIVNDNDCHFIANAVAAATGAVFTDATQSLNPAENEEFGFWRIFYRAPATNAVEQWQTMLQPGDIVRMGWDVGGTHTYTVLSKNANGTVEVYDNIAPNPGGGATGIGIHTVNYDDITNASTVTIYRLTTDGLFLINGTTTYGDTIEGTLFNDYLRGLGGNDSLVGGVGNDVLDGGDGVDTMVGGAGNDVYYVNHASDVVVEGSGAGTDVIRTSLTYEISVNIENLTITGTGARTGTGNAVANIITGNGADNKLRGVAGADTLNGGAGNDTLEGGADVDFMRGEAGNDIYDVDNANDFVRELEGGGTDTVRTSVTRSLDPNVENLIITGSAARNGSGNSQANQITGNTGANILAGRIGADTVVGGGGNDKINGGEGLDVLTGSAGQDAFVFDVAAIAGNADTIVDFNVIDDTIQLDNAIFTQLGAAGALTASMFRIGAAPADPNDYLIYNSATGTLSYDSNGNVAGGAVLIATLASGLALTAEDFLVI